VNIHEHQAKALLREYGAPVADGRAVLRAEEAKAAAGELDGPLWVVKAQIHAGGRGKGHFKEASAGDKGGVRITRSVSEAAEEAQKMLGRTLVTHQTGPAGKQVGRIYIEDGGPALLHKWRDGRGSPFPGRTCPTTSVTGMPRAVQPFRTATRTWNSAT